MVILLILSILTLLLGPLLLHFAGHHKNAIRFLDSFVLCSVFGLVAFHILPESISEAGFWAAIAAAVGLFGPMLLGSYLKTGECHIHGSIISLASIGLIAHAILDGAAISTASFDIDSSGFLLGIAVILHRLPEGVGIWRVTRSQFGVGIGALALFVLIIAVTAGFFFGTQLLDNSSETALVIFQSIMAGTLLHVIFHRHHIEEPEHKHEHAHEHAHCQHPPKPRKRWHKSSGFGALAGIGLVVVLLFIHPEHDHGHGHSHNHEHEHAGHTH